MKSLRIGIVGLGNIGAQHARMLREGQVPGAKLAAVCDIEASRIQDFDGIPRFPTFEAMLAARGIDAMIVATPHFFHTPQGIAALAAGLHVLVEKPISVHKADAARLIAAHTNPAQVFAAMFNQRTDPRYRKLRELIKTGELGALRRVSWTITNWFRTEHYYASGGWRATWSGEGGGVLLNQCPHNLDLFQWLFGLPLRVRAHCHFGKHHDIEVEDEVSAYFELPGGATATFVTSTGETPGTNRLEIAADCGRVVVEDDRLVFTRNETPAREYSRTSQVAFSAPATRETIIPAGGGGGQHLEVLQNFVAAISHESPLIAPAAEGIRSVELANAMLLSTWLDATVELPLDAARYESLLQQRIASSRRKAHVARSAPAADFAASFGR